MHIHDVVSIKCDEEFYYIEIGITLYCSTIRISRSLNVSIRTLDNEMVVVVNSND